ncbi:hypothetical protein EVAR_48694_1 [Eumeta japonica]|uniref:Uncharacterized protein n=1 Tax=Eumeta variegata TaxID=151549 RepID=A0A4C1XCS6_EUMVA|nr:hypothetical protein EVAR_48694_1 [Eumeta japonica]
MNPWSENTLMLPRARVRARGATLLLLRWMGASPPVPPQSGKSSSRDSSSWMRPFEIYFGFRSALDPNPFSNRQSSGHARARDKHDNSATVKSKGARIRLNETTSSKQMAVEANVRAGGGRGERRQCDGTPRSTSECARLKFKPHFRNAPTSIDRDTIAERNKNTCVARAHVLPQSPRICLPDGGVLASTRSPVEEDCSSEEQDDKQDVIEDESSSIPESVGALEAPIIPPSIPSGRTTRTSRPSHCFIFNQRSQVCVLRLPATRRDRFLTLRNALHVVEGDSAPDSEKGNVLWKVQPMIDKVKDTCNKLERVLDFTPSTSK